jgi:hypothetical protein
LSTLLSLVGVLVGLIQQEVAVLVDLELEPD